MRTLLRPLPFLLLAGCWIGDESVPTPIRGIFDLTHLDGQALPRPITIGGEAFVVTAAVVELGSLNNVVWTLMLEFPEGSEASPVELITTFRRVTANNFVFPPDTVEPEFFATREGASLTIASRPVPPFEDSMAMELGGSHNWQFQMRPGTGG